MRDAPLGSLPDDCRARLDRRRESTIGRQHRADVVQIAGQPRTGFGSQAFGAGELLDLGEALLGGCLVEVGVGGGNEETA
ncbi:hypothetical protein [Nocardia asiatica]|uniref:hypothetical protein n=1 Tax=Nocardia asiatica TaxID=209252 RepID=UPI0012F9957B|nr:hypothetical protein [Nocardia asiatica]